MFKGSVGTSDRIDWTSFNFQFKDFLSNQPTKFQAELNFKISVLTFLTSMICSMKLCKEKIFLLQSMSNSTVCLDQRLAVKNSGVFCPVLIFELSTLKNDDPASEGLFKVARYDDSNIVFLEEQS